MPLRKELLLRAMMPPHQAGLGQGGQIRRQGV